MVHGNGKKLQEVKYNMLIDILKKDIINMIIGTGTACYEFLPLCYCAGSMMTGGYYWDKENLIKMTQAELYDLYLIVSKKKVGLYLGRKDKRIAVDMIKRLNLKCKFVQF